MGLERHLSPAKLATLSLAGATLLYLDFCASTLPDRLFPKSETRSAMFAELILGFVLPVALGLWLQFGALKAFQRGIADGLWPAATLQAMRDRIEKLRLVPICAALCFLGIGYTLAHFAHYQHAPPLGGFVYFAASPALAVGNLRKALKPPRDPRRHNWREEIKPIVSEHWGE